MPGPCVPRSSVQLYFNASDCKYDKMSSVVILAVCFTYNSDLTTGLDNPCKIIIHAVNIGLQMDDKKCGKQLQLNMPIH